MLDATTKDAVTVARVACPACDGFGTTGETATCSCCGWRKNGPDAECYERCGLCSGAGSLLLTLPIGFDSGDIDHAIEALRS